MLPENILLASQISTAFYLQKKDDIFKHLFLDAEEMQKPYLLTLLELIPGKLYRIKNTEQSNAVTLNYYLGARFTQAKTLLLS
jgi:hypothetical protein